LALHDWTFQELSAIGMVSRNELAGDNPDDPDSLFWKIDWELTQMPPWMVGIEKVDWKRDRSKHSLLNYRMNSTIVSWAATGEVGSGGRKTWVLMDELSKFREGNDYNAITALLSTTDSRLIVGTPYGARGAYYSIMQLEDSGMKKFTVHWSKNISKNRGLYRFENGKPVAVEPSENPLPGSYDPPTPEAKDRWRRLERKGFNLTKSVRSEWYDLQCDRPGSTPSSIAQELDIDYGGSTTLYFGDTFAKAANRYTQPSRQVGRIIFDTEDLTPEFESVEGGDCRLWCELDHMGMPPHRDYVIGCDISTGTGGSYTSNSTAIVLDQNTGEQVAEIATCIVRPTEFADMVIALSKLFFNAYLAWESNGPGNEFGRRVLEQMYPNIYMRTILWRRSKQRKHRTKPGWLSNRETRSVLFGGVRNGVCVGDYIIRSPELANETSQYVLDGEKIVHVKSVGTSNPSETADNHGDRVIGFGVAIQAMKDRPKVSKKEETTRLSKDPPSGTLAWREMQYEKDDKKGEAGWLIDVEVEDGLAGWT